MLQIQEVKQETGDFQIFWWIRWILKFDKLMEIRSIGRSVWLTIIRTS